MADESPVTIVSSRVIKLSINPTYSASVKSDVLHANVPLVPEDKENVEPLGPGCHRDALVLRPAENSASRIQLHLHLNAQTNSSKGGKPNPDPEPVPAKSRRRRYPLQDITAIMYPGQVNTHTSAGYESNPPIHNPFSGRPPYPYASPRSHLAKRKLSVLSPKKQAPINLKVKKHIGNPRLETGQRAEHAVQDSISTESEKQDTIKKALQNYNLMIRRRQLRRATNCIGTRKAKAEGCFSV